nr:MAG TPA: hypothetical protein [Caudoviricetes sp.]
MLLSLSIFFTFVSPLWEYLGKKNPHLSARVKRENL